MRTALTVALLWAGLVATATAQNVNGLPSLREQAAIRQAWLQERLEDVLPRLMRENRVGMWIVQMSEYNEDPVFRALVSPTRFAARRRSIFVFYDRGPEGGVERLALGGGDQGGVYQSVRDPEDDSRELYLDAQWRVLRQIVEERQPETIAINVSHTHAFSDGLASGERELLEQALGPKWTARFVPAELLPLHYLAIRVPSMRPYYKKMMEIVHDLIATAFSSEVIVPGKTTNSDVLWWLRQQVHDRAMDSWFQPSVSVQRRGAALEGEIVIERGDVLHTDFGIFATGLATDTQHMGYVLREGEDDAPEGLKKALLNANRLQDIVMTQIKPGLTGNQVLASALAQMHSEGIQGRIYNHPIGDHGHGAGPLVGLYDRQEGVPGRGEVRLIPNTWHSIELYAVTPVPEWDNQEVRIALEEDAAMTEDGKMEWILRRQESFHLVR
ncbi:MAG TPA: M24 family metallopeptidase [Vicinamibacteria bacterium]|nr:M24 family metallopeptidase [Vicinamibacteria bacterium]